MYRNRINKLLALFLIANFVFCNTPTSVLHALFAGHRDKTVQCHVDPSIVHFEIAGIDCHCNSNVVNVPYIRADVLKRFQPTFKYVPHPDAIISSPGTIEAFFFSLRAPPVFS